METPVDEGPRLIDDVWVQVLLLLAFMSGFFGHVLIFEHSRRLWAMATGPIQGARQPAEPPTPAALEAPAKRAPRIPGHWVVDARMSPGSDCETLGIALANAADGDAITLKPGVYNESVSLSKSVTISGAGNSPQDVWLTSAGERTVAAAKARASLENLTLSNTGNSSDLVAQITEGYLSLKNVNVRSAGYGLSIQDANVDIYDSVLESRKALTIRGNGRIRLLRTRIAAKSTGISAEGSQVELLMERTNVQSGEGPALETSRFTKASMTDGSFSHSEADAVVVNSGAEVKIADSTISDNRGCGVSEDGGIVYLTKVHLSRNRCGVGFVGPGTLEVNGSTFTGLSLGPLAIKPGLENKVVIRGSDNAGLNIPKKE